MYEAMKKQMQIQPETEREQNFFSMFVCVFYLR